MTSFSMEPVLQVQDIVYRFHGTNFGIQCGKFSITPGCKCVVMGANGSGKTTFFLTLNGTLRPQKGRILLDGNEASYSSAFLHQWRSRVGLVLQDPNVQLIGGSVMEDVALGPRNLGLSRAEVKDRVDVSLKDLGISDLRNRSIHELSYGQKKRVALAGILAMKPAILLLDEPTAGLDARGSRELMSTLDSLHSSGIAIVMSSHDSDLAYAWAHQVMVFEQGSIMMSGSPSDVFQEVRRLKLDCVGMPKLFT